MILAPVIVSKAKKEADETESVLVGFKPHAVFAADQTDMASGGRGRPLPEPVRITKDVAAPEVFERSVETLRDVCLGLGDGVISSCQTRDSWGQGRAFSPASWDHLIARVMGPPARVADPFSPGSWGQPIARVMGPPDPALG